MPLLSTLSIVFFGVASAQHVCKDDTNFDATKPFVTGYGRDGNRTCGDWKTTHFSDVMDSYDKCISEMSFDLYGIAGVMKMSKAQILSYMASPSNGRDNPGCCGDSTEGSSCDQFMDQLPQPPCDANWKQEDGKCMPCYGVMKDKESERECLQCWGADTRGCGADDCGPAGGEWVAPGVSGECPEGCCRLCNEMFVKECPQHMCEDKGGMWDIWDNECRSCRPEMGDVSGCDQQTCIEAGQGWKTWEHCDPTCNERGMCQRCAPEDNDMSGCSQERCDATANARWDEFDEECRVCAPDDDRYEGCDRQACEDAGGMYKTWQDCDETGACRERGNCMPCIPHDDRYEGCDKARCDEESAKDNSIVWRCETTDCEGTGGECQKCSHDNWWGCPDQQRCEDVARTWCGTHCSDNCPPPAGGMECNHDSPHNCHDEASCMGAARIWCMGTHCTDTCAGEAPEFSMGGGEGDPIPDGECNMFDGPETSPRSSGNMAKNSDNPEPWNMKRWTVEIHLRMPGDFDELYREEWVGLLGSDGGDHPYVYFNNGRLKVEKQNGPHPDVASIDIREAGMQPNGEYIIEVQSRPGPPQEWYMAVRDKMSNDIMNDGAAHRTWNYDYQFTRGANYIGSGYKDDETFPGTISCVTFRGEPGPENALKLRSLAAPGGHHGGGGNCEAVPRSTTRALEAAGFQPRYC